jgi:nitric oxide reductase subunit B
MDLRRAWLVLTAVLISTFLLLGFFGREIYRHAPPIPERIVGPGGELIASADDILTGQQAWQSMGGQQVGSIWGHGAYQAPDWSADWLHRECVALLELWSERDYGQGYDQLAAEPAAGLRERLRGELRKNSFDPRSGALVLSADRLAALRATAAHYKGLFGGDPAWAELRESYALKKVSVAEPSRLHAMSLFFFWTSWACATERPDSGGVSYTNNWPHEPLIGNVPSAASVLWSIISVVLLLAAVGLVIAWQARRGSGPEDEPSKRSSGGPPWTRCA